MMNISNPITIDILVTLTHGSITVGHSKEVDLRSGISHVT